MAKTKSELEFDYRQHQAVMAKVRNAHRAGDTRNALRLAISAWDYIDGMMQYERRYGSRSEYTMVDSLDFVLSYAPVLFEAESLDQLGGLLKAQRRIEKNTTVDVGKQLEDAKSLMWDAHRLWNHLEKHGEVFQGDLSKILGGDQRRWRDLAETWAHLGVIERQQQGGSYVLRLSTRLDDAVPAKCSTCGVVEHAAKSSFLDARDCVQCSAHADFVLITLYP